MAVILWRSRSRKNLSLSRLSQAFLRSARSHRAKHQITVSYQTSTGHISELLIHCAKPPFPGRPTAAQAVDAHAGRAAPPTQGGGSGLSYHVFRGAMTGRCLASGEVRLGKQCRVGERRKGRMIHFFSNKNPLFHTIDFLPHFFSMKMAEF